MNAFIFDFDGVIVDSELHWDRDALAFYQTIIPSFTREDDKNLKGRNLNDIYKMLVSDYGVTMSKEEYNSLIDTFADRLYKEQTQLIAGTKELIERIRELKVPIAIASSGERRWINVVLERMNMTDVFNPIVLAADVGIGKPDPTVYLEAARILNVDPVTCVAYEDSTNGLRSAKSAGMTCVAIKHPWGYEQDLSLADMIVTSHDELTAEILRSL